MSDNKQTNDLGSKSEQKEQPLQPNQSKEIITFPSVPKEQRANIEKAEDTKPSTKK